MSIVSIELGLVLVTEYIYSIILLNSLSLYSFHGYLQGGYR